VVLAGIDESGAGGDGLVGWDAGHGHRVGGDPVWEARPQGSLPRHIARFYFLNINKENLVVVSIYFLLLSPISWHTVFQFQDVFLRIGILR
jgi:hypothetical protein